VYNLGIHQVKTRGQLSPEDTNLKAHHTKPGYIHTVIPKLSPLFNPQYTQHFLPHLPLNNLQLYTVSTVPTNTRTKEK